MKPCSVYVCVCARSCEISCKKHRRNFRRLTSTFRTLLPRKRKCMTTERERVRGGRETGSVVEGSANVVPQGVMRPF